MKARAKRQRARATRRAQPRPYKPVAAADVTDLALLPGEFRQFRSLVIDELRMLGEKILPMITRHDKIIDDHHVRILEGERAQFATNDRQDATEKKLEAIHADVERLKAAASGSK